MAEERWTTIEGWEGRYDISDCGRVRSWFYGKKKLLEPRVLKLKLDRYGYLTVSLHQGDRKKSYTVHRLVAKAFLLNPQSLPQINHKNGDKTDNRVSNLEWCSASLNIKHAFEKGLISKENCSQGQTRRYKSREQREVSRLTALKMWNDPEKAKQLRNARRTEEYREKASKIRHKQEPPTKGRRRIHNGVQEKVVPSEQLKEYLKQGWRPGRRPIQKATKDN